MPLPVRPDLIYLLAFKPVGVVSTAHDPQGRPTVVDLAGTDLRVFPVGRLNTDSEGLILLTNDGDLTFRITHPSSAFPKTYSVLVEGEAGPRFARRLTEGVELDDGPANAASARVVDARPDRSLVEIVMAHGREREDPADVRRPRVPGDKPGADRHRAVARPGPRPGHRVSADLGRGTRSVRRRRASRRRPAAGRPGGQLP